MPATSDLRARRQAGALAFVASPRAGTKSSFNRRSRKGGAPKGDGDADVIQSIPRDRHLEQQLRPE